MKRFVLLLCFGCFILIGAVVAVLHFMAQKKKKDIKRQSSKSDSKIFFKTN